jgi:chloramphenicol 3-O phosphotransferase
VPRLYAALYESVAAHSQLGLNVVVDVGHHDGHATVHGILADCARRLAGLPALLVGVRCPIETIMQRRAAGQTGREGLYLTGTSGDPVPEPVRRWQATVHEPGVYDLEVDTSVLSAADCAAAIGRRLIDGLPSPTAFQQLAKAEQRDHNS